MNTIVLQKPEKLILEDTSEPGDPPGGEALVQVHRVGVCGTDLHAYRGIQPFFQYPRILGHELGVEILAVGPNDQNLAPGDRCSVEPYLNCGKCIACRRGKGNCCTSLRVMGVHVDGGYRERIHVPVHKLHRSNDLGYDQLALVETLGIGAHAVARAQIESGEVVLVIGGGPIGLSVIQFAKAAGARVIVMDLNENRLAFCREAMGVDATLRPSSSESVVAQLEELADGDQPTVVLDATGNANSMQSAFYYPAHGGRLVFVGLFQGDVTFHDPDFHKRELTLLGSRNARPEDFRNIIGMIENGRIDTTPWITHRAPLKEVPERFPEWTRPESGVLKAMIEVS
ncbi:zinc-binding alcohol dehydrogenase family protein [Puniceicoccus vermicola]|uniref:Zinc-binding alcohol dehydrogenase family protein n=1 Tax=Puniceicoccus vermicola TaxID=388746 RepID=A0A7X1AZC3_9BACT|nr:zinc-binding alcohol dehydrogenase family protein [Puniceicoccus vermicola]MBC2602559.1 zinc-binding alcohol dehydrogenase family protein [Puniceicoccus vermicola]